MSYEQCPKCHGVLEDDGTCSCGYGVKRRGQHAPTDKIDRTCPWNDHGHICGLVGSLSDSTNGQGPWYCSMHFWKLKGWPEHAGKGDHVTFRDRWYEEHLNEPRTPASMEPTETFQPMASTALYDRLFAGQLGPPRTRQPGED